MTYQICQKNNNVTVESGFKSEKDAYSRTKELNLDPTQYFVCPESYEYRYSYRHNGYRWMEPFDI